MGFFTFNFSYKTFKKLIIFTSITLHIVSFKSWISYIVRVKICIIKYTCLYFRGNLQRNANPDPFLKGNEVKKKGRGVIGKFKKKCLYILIYCVFILETRIHTNVKNDRYYVLIYLYFILFFFFFVCFIAIFFLGSCSRFIEW